MTRVMASGPQFAYAFRRKSGPGEPDGPIRGVSGHRRHGETVGTAAREVESLCADPQSWAS